MRTNFHGLAIDSTLVRLDFDKLLCSVHFDTKLQQNGKLFFHVSYIGVSADWLRICKNASVLRVRPSALGPYFKEKGIQFGAEYLIRFLNQPFGYNSRSKGKDFFNTSKSISENYREQSNKVKDYTYSVDILGIVEDNFCINFGYWMVPKKYKK